MTPFFSLNNKTDFLLAALGEKLLFPNRCYLIFLIKTEIKTEVQRLVSFV